MNVAGLKYAYSKLSTFLGLEENLDQGITMIVTPNWMFVSVLSSPYHVEKSNGYPLYLDGFAYSGIYNLQNIKQVWPATTGLGKKKHGVFDAIHLQSTPILKEDKDEEDHA